MLAFLKVKCEHFILITYKFSELNIKSYPVFSWTLPSCWIRIAVKRYVHLQYAVWNIYILMKNLIIVWCIMIRYTQLSEKKDAKGLNYIVAQCWLNFLPQDWICGWIELMHHQPMCQLSNQDGNRFLKNQNITNFNI